MITAWQVYWVLQLDSIKSVLEVIGNLLIMAGSMCLGAWAFLRINDSGNFSEQQLQSFFYAARRFCFASALILVVDALFPSTQTAAAMIILPEITSPEFAQPLKGEARDLYELAKRALVNMARKDVPQ